MNRDVATIIQRMSLVEIEQLLGQRDGARLDVVSAALRRRDQITRDRDAREARPANAIDVSGRRPSPNRGAYFA